MMTISTLAPRFVLTGAATPLAIGIEPFSLRVPGVSVGAVSLRRAAGFLDTSCSAILSTAGDADSFAFGPDASVLWGELMATSTVSSGQVAGRDGVASEGVLARSRRTDMPRVHAPTGPVVAGEVVELESIRDGANPMLVGPSVSQVDNGPDAESPSTVNGAAVSEPDPTSPEFRMIAGQRSVLIDLLKESGLVVPTDEFADGGITMAGVPSPVLVAHAALHSDFVASAFVLNDRAKPVVGHSPIIAHR